MDKLEEVKYRMIVAAVKKFIQLQQLHFMDGKSWENVLVCDYIFNRQRIYSSYRDVKFFTRCMKGVSFVNKRYAKGVLVVSQQILKKARMDKVEKVK